MASFPSSWIITAGEPSKGPPPRANAVSSVSSCLKPSSPSSPHREPLLGIPSRSFNTQFLLPSASEVPSDLRIPKSKGWSKGPTRSYPTSFPTEWLLASPTAGSSNSKTVYQNTPRDTSSRASFASHFSAQTTSASISTPTSSQRLVQRLDLAPAEYSKLDNTTGGSKQGDTLVKQSKGYTATPAGKEKQAETRKWLHTVEGQSIPPRMQEVREVIDNQTFLKNHNMVEFEDRDDLSDYSGLGDAPYNALDVPDNYSMYTESAYHSNTQ